MSKKSKTIIANTLVDLMGRFTFEEITISEICDNTPLVRKTFYNNFSSKEDVISYVVEGLVNEYHSALKEINNYSTLEMSYVYFDFGKKNEHIMTLMIKNNLFHLFRSEFEKNLPLIHDLVDQNKLKSLASDDLKYVFAFHTAGVIRLLELWIKTGFEKSPREMSRIYHAISLGV